MNALTGTAGLIRLILRRDRFLLPLWILWLGAIPAGFTSATAELYPTAADQGKYAATIGANPTFLALYGPMYDPGLGGIVVQRASLIAVVIALIAALTVIRHTRAEEEAGRRELLGATRMGRAAPLAAALAVTMTACVVVGALAAAGMASQDLPAAGSIAFGLQLALAGVVFAAVAGLAAQLTIGAAAARGLSLAVLGAAFVVRMAADSADGLTWLGWASPLGWVQRSRPYEAERWWTFALGAALALALAWAAARMTARRDLGAGLLPDRLGPADASRGLRGPFSLAWRLHRRSLAGWLAGFAALGAVYGGFGGSVGDLIADNPELGDVFARLGGEAGLIDAYFSSAMGIMGLIACGYAVSATLRLRAEESSLHLEPVMATPTGRLRWAAAHLTMAAAGSAAILAAGGLAAGLVHGLSAGGSGESVRVLGIALAQIPAVWVLGSVGTILFGALPLLMLVGAALDLDPVLLDLSPFAHVPKLGAGFTAAPLTTLTAAAFVLTAVGLAAFRRRDLSFG
ncbi:ABC-2 type transport system permease protein [Actinocorallia herbida]|uniref:ABC-2 type transport system permease protein n=1 Tax=Actinocorallia herbida TaxID=58109 RepID=A0A3N1D2C5_9ACTN|nr:ABC transporter permease [Actinocorallia herbida]ROO87685.1 ABC-2 type transport system permease protein [Actinocorallia herbida]